MPFTTSTTLFKKDMATLSETSKESAFTTIPTAVKKVLRCGNAKDRKSKSQIPSKTHFKRIWNKPQRT